VIVRKERPHPGAQLRFTDIGGHRFTAACGCASPPPGPGPPSSPPRSPACKPSHPADQHQTAPATRKDKTHGPWNPAHPERQPGSQPRPGAEISKRPQSQPDSSRSRNIKVSTAAWSHCAATPSRIAVPGRSAPATAARIRKARYNALRIRTGVDTPRTSALCLKGETPGLPPPEDSPISAMVISRFTYKSRWLKDLTSCGEFRKQNISICSVFARHDHPVLWYGGVLSRDRS
jgi:hypothetical protein